jgi:hypothetical protein
MNMEDQNLTKLAVTATIHCLSGCAIGEILGTVIGSGLNWSNPATEALTIPLAFLFGYSLTVRTLRRHKVDIRKAVRLALAADSLSIITMEAVDTLIILLIPGALAAGPATVLFWSSLIASLLVAFVCAVPVNRYLIARGKGHAVVHRQH